ncbi:pseudouridine synthase [Marinobacter fuscus]|uniref:Pseudouridine synthase n=1 Tax=Marinobacter fuscus TaxID=2109942 RepID=A0A2T1K596_9GAMM|nr:YqcC family protein [Marinobacter fuscus]PSF05311.1 pseudouridine synthase [Marinobacter fuscus]
MSDDSRQVHRVADSLLNIEIELRRLELWQEDRPAPEAFQSTQPFCIDTMTFPQWLQFVFLERMAMMVEAGEPLPSISGIAPMVEEHFRGLPQSGRQLQAALEEMDRLLTGEGQ